MNRAIYSCMRLMSIGGMMACCAVMSGAVVSQEGLTYELADDGRATVVTAASGAYEGEISVPSGIEVDGKSYVVTGIGTGAFYGSGVTDVALPGSVTEIGEMAFGNCASLAGVDLGDGVERIGASAFWGCTALDGVDLPDSLREVGDGAFSGCRSLRVLVLPDGVTYVGEDLCSGCVSLVELGLPVGMTRLPAGLLRDCVSLSGVEIPESVIWIGEESMMGCENVSELVLPPSLVRIGRWALAECQSLGSVVIPAGVDELSAGVLSHCTSLQWIGMGSGVKVVSDGALQGCSHLEAVIMNDVQVIGSSALSGCDNLRHVYVNSALPPVAETSTFDAVAYDAGTLYVPQGCRTLYSQTSVWERFGRIVELAEFPTEWSGVGMVVGGTPVSVSGHVLKIGDVYGEWSVCDMNGRVVASGHEGNAEVSVSANGVYVVKVAGRPGVRVMVND